MEYDDHYNYTDTWEEQIEYQQNIQATIRMVVQGSATAVGLLANILLLVVFSTAPRLCTTPNVILLQRAIADTLSLIAMIFFLAFGTSGGTGTCIAFSAMLHVGVVASYVLLMAFTLDSYQAATLQHHSISFRRKTMWLTSALAWSLGVAGGIASCFFTYANDGQCFVGPFFGYMSNFIVKIIELFILFLVPLIVAWVFVSMALPPRPTSSTTEATAGEEKGPNRRLLLGLVSSFTVIHGIYWIVAIVQLLISIRYTLHIIYVIIMSLPTLGDALNPILVICLSEEVRQVVAGWLPSRRRSSSLPLQDL